MSENDKLVAGKPGAEVPANHEDLVALLIAASPRPDLVPREDLYVPRREERPT